MSEEIMFEGVPQEEFERFYMVFGGHIFFETLHAAVEFDLFTKLSTHRRLTQSSICELLGIQRQPARILLLGLVTTGLLKKEGEYYFNSDLAEIVLTSHSPRNVLSYVKLQHHVMYKGMFHLTESLREYRNVGLCEFPGDEPTLYERLGRNADVKQIFQDAMHELSVHANRDLAQHVDLSDTKYLIDVGGGDGTNAIELAKAYPHLHTAVFDLPAMCPIAERKIHASPQHERVRVIAGNCFADEFPKGADCFLFSHFCTIWSAKKNQTLFRKTYDALPENGKIIVFNMMQENDESGPISTAVGSPYFLTIATGEGMLYTWAEYEGWMREAGFREIQTVRLPRDHGAIIGIK